MWAMIVKEFRQMRRDRRTLAMMIVMPVVLLIVFGYAASFDVTTIPTVAAGPEAGQAAHLLGQPFQVVQTQPSQGRAWAGQQLRDGHAAGAVVTGRGRPLAVIGGSQLLAATAGRAAPSTPGSRSPAARQVPGSPAGRQARGRAPR